MDNLTKYILLFFFYSFAGWCLESTYCSIGEKRWVNRGFLTGPLCPIYGTAALVLIILIYNPFRDKPLIAFLLGIILCDIVEYFTSLIMEKLFAARWWDYTWEFMNINGRICLKHSLYWGVISIAFIKVFHPAVENFYLKINTENIKIILTVVLIVFAFDVLNAVRKAADIRKLQKKLNNIIDVLSGSLSDIKGTIEERYAVIQEIFEKQGDKVNEFKRQIDDVVLDFDSKITRKNKTSAKEKNLFNRVLYNNIFLEKNTRNKLKKITDLIDAFKANISENGEKQ